MEGLNRKLLGVDPNDGKALQRRAAELSQESGDLDQALACAQRAASLLPEAGEVSDTLGWIYLKKGQTDEAVEVLKALVEREPDTSTYQYHLGMALIGKGDRTNARTALENALLFSKTERPDIQALLLALDGPRK